MVIAALVAYAASASVALYALERGMRPLALVTKPLTTVLLLPIVGPPTSTLRELVWAGVIASVAGDAALLGAGTVAFMIGVGCFLIAHAAYIAAFATVAVWSAASWAGVALVAAATPVLVRILWPRVAGLRGPVLAYAAAISAMIVAAFSTVGGALPAPALAAAGAVLFYVSDAALAIHRFVRPLRHATLLSVGVYWLGQLGIALASRGAAP